mmetsp:Transcript_86781/g.173227  ORF Transcript_86781/g.173227 Transcript_86781/m.173227 type:complete len:205 (+) Transcript_86781:458-1072(+)
MQLRGPALIWRQQAHSDDTQSTQPRMTPSRWPRCTPHRPPPLAGMQAQEPQRPKVRWRRAFCSADFAGKTWFQSTIAAQMAARLPHATMASAAGLEAQWPRRDSNTVPNGTKLKMRTQLRAPCTRPMPQLEQFPQRIACMVETPCPRHRWQHAPASGRLGCVGLRPRTTTLFNCRGDECAVAESSYVHPTSYTCQIRVCPSHAL